MPKRAVITEQEVADIEKAKNRNKDKTVDKWLEVLLLHAQGFKRAEISEKTGFKEKYISELVGRYRRNGLDIYASKQYKGNHRNMSFDEETEFLKQFEESAQQGQIIETGEIKKAYEEKIGREVGSSQIYYVLKRHNWRKVMPRSKHPNKASDEAIDASKKLSL